jgi:protein subunit release factor A
MKTLWWSRRKKDFILEWFSGTGAGGQHRNKHPNCLRLRDKETGITTTGQSQKSRIQNQKEAFHKMIKKLIEYYKNLEIKEAPNRSSDVNKATRTYHECDDRVVDHITNKQYSYKHTVGKEDISSIVEDRVKYMKREIK